MIDEQTINEEFILRFYWNIVLNSMHRFEVDYIIDEYTTNEEFILRFDWNIVLNSKQRFEVDCMIDEHIDKWRIHTKILLNYCAQFEAHIWSWLHDRRTDDKWMNSY